MSSGDRCTACGTIVPAGTPAGLCGRCLLVLGLQQEQRTADSEVGGQTSEARDLGPELRGEKSDVKTQSAAASVHSGSAALAPKDAAGLVAQTAAALGTGSTVVLPLTEKPGDKIGRYKLLEKIGEGGFGVVYVAEQKEPLKRRVALKIIKLGMDTRQVVARFEAERQALALMDHPNIAQVHDAGATETGRPYFVMELVKGIKITEYCDQKNLTTRERLELFMQVCQAIQHAHQKGIIHRDIKPSNILVTPHDGVPVCKVIDFGIAKATQGELTDKTVYTQFQQFIGTPAYMSPEQAEISGLDVDTRSDIYSLGVLLYELLVGKTPFDAQELLASGLDEMRRTIREREPLRPSTRLSSMLGEELTTTAERRAVDAPKLISLLRGDLDWIVMKCLEKDRTRRYETANGLARDVERHLNNEPVVARPPSNIYRFQKLVRRNRLIVSAAAAVVTALVLGVVVSTWLAIQASRARSAAVRAQAAERQQRLNAETERGAAVAAQKQAEEERRRVEEEKRLAQQHLYSASLNLVQLAWEQNNFGRMRQLLEETSLSPDRGFEWYYWQAQTHPELQTLPHQGAVLAVAISQDGQRVVTGCWDHTAKVWDSSRGRVLLTLEGHKAEVGAVAISQDGRWIITGSLDERARVWDSSTGRVLFTLEGHTAAVSSVAFSADNLRIVTGSYDRTAKVWEVTGGLSADPTAKELFTLKGHSGAIESVAISPDGRRIVTGSQDQTAKVWEASGGNQLFALTGHSNAISSVAFSPDGLRIVTGSKDQTARVWEASSGKILLTLKGHKNAISSVAFFPNGERIVTGSHDQTVRVWDASDGKELRELKGHRNWINSVAISAKGQRIVTGSEDETAKVWDITSSKDLLSFQGQEHAIMGITIFPDGRIATGTYDTTAKLWEPFTGRELHTLQGHTGRVLSVAFSLDGQRIVTGSEDNTAIVWDASTGKELLPLKGHTNWLRAVAFSHDGQRIVTGSEDHTAIVWEAASGKELLSLRGHTGVVWVVAFSPDGQRIITGSEDHSAKVWEAASGNLLLTLAGHSNDVISAAFSPDSQRIVTGSKDWTAKVWEASSGNLLHTLRGHNDEVWAVAFSPDRKRILTGSWDKTAKVWMTASGRELLILKGHNAAVLSVGFSPDGRRIFTGSWDLTAKVWEAATPEQVAVWQAAQPEVPATATPLPPQELSPRALELVPEFFCLCDDNEGKGCGMNLAKCNCKRNPGQRRMKVFIQTLVELGKSNDEIRAAMVAKYSESVKFSK